jgi:hypothetical protein
MGIEFKKGVFWGLKIYLAGFVLTLLIHLIFGWKNHHSPPESIYGIFFTLIFALIRIIINISSIITKDKFEINKGELYCHLIIWGLITLFLFIIFSIK